MQVYFDNEDLDRLETDRFYAMGLPDAVVKKFRLRMQMIRNAVDERDLRGIGSVRFEKLQGKRQNQYSMRLNDQFRLILAIEGSQEVKRIRIISVEDYH